MNNPLVQLEVNKPVIKDLLRDLLTQFKDFKTQIAMTVLLSKPKKMKMQNSILFILILQLKQMLVLTNMALTNYFKNFYME